jgi:hypothetical protein
MVSGDQVKKRTKIIAVSTLAAALLTPAASAFATSSYIGWSVNLPATQAGIDASYQVKTTKSSPAQIRVTSVGSGYTLNARFCRVDVAPPNEIESCGTEKFNLGGGDSANLPNTYVVAGNTGFLNLHNSTWLLVPIPAHGTWRAQ